MSTRDSGRVCVREDLGMSWPLTAWKRIMLIVLVNRRLGSNVITALASFTVATFILALALILRDWGFSQPQRLVLTLAAFILMALSVAAGIGLSIMLGDPLSYGRAFGLYVWLNPVSKLRCV